MNSGVARQAISAVLGSLERLGLPVTSTFYAEDLWRMILTNAANHGMHPSDPRLLPKSDKSFVFGLWAEGGHQEQ